MDRGLYIAASGMLAELARQDQLANDLANTSTPGYKADRSAQSSFADALIVNERTGTPIGSLPYGTAISAVRTDMAQGAFKDTGEPLDIALDGDGFFAVKSPAGVRYTRDGQFSLDAKGTLVNASGYPVLDDKGNPIVITGTAKPIVAPDGTVSVAGKAVATLAVVTLEGAHKEGDTLFAGKPGNRPKETAVRQGFLEASAVNVAQAMVDMITSMRAYESTQRVIHAIDETLGRGINGSQQ
jgi:flagellar basal-body rod protein FlgF